MQSVLVLTGAEVDGKVVHAVVVVGDGGVGDVVQGDGDVKAGGGQPSLKQRVGILVGVFCLLTSPRKGSG